MLLAAGISWSSTGFAADEQTSILTACSAFAENGYSATATVGQDAIVLDVANPSGQSVSHWSMSLHHRMPASMLLHTPGRGDRTCELFIDRASDLVAVGVVQASERPNITRLQVDIAELKGAKLVADFTVEPSADFLPTSLAGFLEDTNRLVVTGRAPTKNAAETQTISIATLLFDSAGKQLSAAPVVREANGSDAFRAFADAEHNRLWLFSCALTRANPYHVPVCPISVTTLNGDNPARVDFDPSSHVQKRNELWMWPNAFAALSANSILVGETIDGKDTLWEVNVQKRAMDRFGLPKGHWVKYNGVTQAHLSPDGEVLALLIDQIKLGAPYFVDNYEFKGTDVVVVQLHPFRLLARIPHTDSGLTTGLAVDHHQGRTCVLVYRQGQFERINIGDQSR